MNSTPLARELVLVGGGHTHVLLLRMLGMNPVPGLRVTLVTPAYRTPYSGMLPGHIAGHYSEDEMHIDLAPLCAFAGATLIVDEACGMDLAAGLVHCRTRPDVRYDVASIDIGITPHVPDGLAHPRVIPVKPISAFLDKWRTFEERVRNGARIGVIGAGAGGVELLLAAQHRLMHGKSSGKFAFHLFAEGDTLLADYPVTVRRRFEGLLRRRDVTLHQNFRAAQYADGVLVAESGASIDIDAALLVTDAAPQRWPVDSGLAADAAGFIRVRDTLQTESHGNVFATGDCAVSHHARPRAGVYAVRQAAPLYRNVLRYLTNNPLAPYRPQRRFLSLISTGDKAAVASRNGVSVQGGWVWRWKDWIDRRFMQRFERLPQMTNDKEGPFADEFDDQMQCGGCGSKVGADLLGEVLEELLGEERSVEDASVLELPGGALVLQSVDHFRAFIDDPYLFARIAVVHALSDIHACGGKAHQAHAMVTLPFAKPAITRGLLTNVMRGALDQLCEDGVTLAGGHTAHGAELSIGFSVTGFAGGGQMWRKQGLNVGDALMLTKPLGTGTLLAAHMRHAAKGAWLGAAMESMQRSNRAAAEVLHAYPVSACTDVTGFGLAGHLAEMLQGANVGAALDASAIPMLPGAEHCLANLGIRSTLHDTNAAAANTLGVPAILFDPQTAGGLLVGMPADAADACVTELHSAGYNQATIIGRVTDTVGISVH